jgi:hypothetical protein
MDKNLGPRFLSGLRQGIVATFNLEELKNLCLDLGVTYDNLPGEALESKARELIDYLRHRGELAQLVARCKELRPNYAWTPQEAAGPSPEQVEITAGGEAKTTVLFLLPYPADPSERVRVGAQGREIAHQLQLSKLRDRFDYQPRPYGRLVDITQALFSAQPQIVHFAGHGRWAGPLCLENESGETQPVSAEAIAALFKQCAGQVQCVILNAGYSDIQATAIAKHVEHVIGMNQAMGDKAVIAFVVGFYQALGAGRTIGEAYKWGCQQVCLLGLPEDLVPSLVKK